MKALTLWRPWPEAIFHPDPARRKTIENRRWRPPFGLLGNQLAIHSGQKMAPGALDVIEEIIDEDLGGERWPGGFVVGSSRSPGPS